MPFFIQVDAWLEGAEGEVGRTHHLAGKFGSKKGAELFCERLVCEGTKRQVLVFAEIGDPKLVLREKPVDSLRGFLRNPKEYLDHLVRLIIQPNGNLTRRPFQQRHTDPDPLDFGRC